MKKILMIMIASLISATAFADGTYTNVPIVKIQKYTGEAGTKTNALYVVINDGNDRKIWIDDDSSANMKDVLSILLTAATTGKNVTIEYNDGTVYNMSGQRILEYVNIEF